CLYFSSRRLHTRSKRDWSSDVCSSDLLRLLQRAVQHGCGFYFSSHDDEGDSGGLVVWGVVKNQTKESEKIEEGSVPENLQAKKEIGRESCRETEKKKIKTEYARREKED